MLMPGQTPPQRGGGTPAAPAARAAAMFVPDSVPGAPEAVAPRMRLRAPRRHDLADTLPQAQREPGRGGVCSTQHGGTAALRGGAPTRGRAAPFTETQCVPRGLAWPPRQHKRVMKTVIME